MKEVEITQEMCALGVTDEVFSIDEQIVSEDAKIYMRISSYTGDGYCGDRYGPSVYLENTHPNRSISCTFEVIFDNQSPTNEMRSVPPRSRVHIGCSYWRPDYGHVQYYQRRILSGSFE